VGPSRVFIIMWVTTSSIISFAQLLFGSCFGGCSVPNPDVNIGRKQEKYLTGKIV
jgi:hypothetical protein